MNTKCFEQNSYVGLFDQIAYNIPTRQSLGMHKIKIEKKRDKQYIYWHIAELGWIEINVNGFYYPNTETTLQH